MNFEMDTDNASDNARFNTAQKLLGSHSIDASHDKWTMDGSAVVNV
jgi:hypothetical protein